MPKYFETAKIKELAHPILINLGIHCIDFRYPYEEICTKLAQLQHDSYAEYLQYVRALAEKDFLFFSYYVLDLPLGHPYLIARCYETQDLQDERYVLLLAGRNHYKSVINTIAFPLWRALNHPNETFAIFSFEKGKAEGQLLSIKQLCEYNTFLYELWPNVFKENKNSSETAKWSIDKGLCLKRTTTVKEPTFAAFAFIQGTPVSTHFDYVIVDDPVTEANSRTSGQNDQIRKGYAKLTYLLTDNGKMRTIATRYDVSDLSSDLLKDDRYKKIIIPAEVNEQGQPQRFGIPVLLTREQLDNKIKDLMIESIDAEFEYHCQYLQDPQGAVKVNPKRAWLQHYAKLPENLYKYVFVDPANSKNTDADYSVLVVLGTSSDNKYYLVDMIRDKLDVFERFNAMYDLNLKHSPELFYYEAQANSSDMTIIEQQLLNVKVPFFVEKVQSNESGSKMKRMQNLLAVFKRGDFLLPETLPYMQEDGREVDLVQEFIITEFLKFPRLSHDDMLDAMSWILKVPNIEFPDEAKEKEDKVKKDIFYVNPLETTNNETTWMSSYV
jgi:predicted phage terminase large subunit-like protein